MTREEMTEALEARGIHVPSAWKVGQVRALYDEVMTAPPEEEWKAGPYGNGGHSPRG